MKTETIFTHNGTFYADEVLSVALLQIVNHDINYHVIRTRDEEILMRAKQDKTVFVLDVGGEYNPEYNNLDHHHREFNEINKTGTRYSSFGLVVKHCKETIVNQYSEAVYNYLEDFSVKVDNHDNGVSQSPELYWISDLNNNDGDSDSNFSTAVQCCVHWLRSLFNQWNARVNETILIEKAVEEAKATNSSFAVIEDKVEVDERLNQHEFLKVIVTTSGVDQWKVQSLNAGLIADFSCRYPAPEEWRGKRNFMVEDIEVVFCHNTGFMTVVKTKADAIKLAKVLVANKQ